MIKKSIFLNKIILSFSFLIIFTSHPLYSKQKQKDEVYIKYVHPRVYEFDLCDAETTVFLGYNNFAEKYDAWSIASNKFDGYADFTKFVKGDRPQAGDKVVFSYKGYAKKDCEIIYADIYDGKQSLTDNNSGVFVHEANKNVEFQGKLSFILKEDCKDRFVLRIWSSKKNVPGQLDQCNLKFSRIVETTNTVKEVEAEKKALKNNIEIIEVQTEIIDDTVAAQTELSIASQKAAEIVALTTAEEQKRIEAAKLESARIEAERLEKIKIEQERLEQERLEKERLEKEKLDLERKKQEEEIQKAIDAVSKVTRYEKEYLNDYIVYDTPVLLNQEEAVDELIDNPDETDTFGRTLLMKAAKAGNDWQIKTLLKSGANVNLRDKDGWTALMYAVRYQESIVCVDLLVDAGADVKAVNNYNSSVLTIAACYNNNPEVLRKLLSNYSIAEKDVLKSLVLLLSENQTTEYIQLAKLNIYMDLSVPLNTFYEGKTPLMYAAEFGTSTKVLKTLMDNNAIVTIRSTEGKTAYDYASSNKNLKHDNNYWALNKK